MNINGVKPPPHFFEFKLAHLLTIILLCGFGISWWIRHEDVASRADAQQTMMLNAHIQRFEQVDRRMEQYERTQNEIIPDIREVKTKLNIMAELLDGEHRRPELHK